MSKNNFSSDAIVKLIKNKERNLHSTIEVALLNLGELSEEEDFSGFFEVVSDSLTQFLFSVLEESEIFSHFITSQQVLSLVMLGCSPELVLLVMIMSDERRESVLDRIDNFPDAKELDLKNFLAENEDFTITEDFGFVLALENLIREVISRIKSKFVLPNLSDKLHKDVAELKKNRNWVFFSEKGFVKLKSKLKFYGPSVFAVSMKHSLEVRKNNRYLKEKRNRERIVSSISYSISRFLVLGFALEKIHYLTLVLAPSYLVFLGGSDFSKVLSTRTKTSIKRVCNLHLSSIDPLIFSEFYSQQ